MESVEWEVVRKKRSVWWRRERAEGGRGRVVVRRVGVGGVGMRVLRLMYLGQLAGLC
jgi:hypothetical protein